MTNVADNLPANTYADRVRINIGVSTVMMVFTTVGLLAAASLLPGCGGEDINTGEEIMPQLPAQTLPLDARSPELYETATFAMG